MLRARSALVLLLFVPRIAFAREPAAVDETAEDLDIEEQTFGTRGLVRTRAESVSFDGKERSIELAGNVRIDAPPFHLRSGHIRLSRTRWGIEADGDGKLAFCPCLGTPVTIAFEKAIVAPPGELILKSPTLEIYGVPVLYLPWFWMRSDEKVGVLPPEVAYRGTDGVFLGEGVHVPWKDRGARDSLDLRGGAYLTGGFVADVRLRTPVSTTKVRLDRLHGDDGLTVDARGATVGDATVAWDADLLRGRRAVRATSDLDAAAKPWDRASASATIMVGPILAETGARAVTRRGGDLDAVDTAGPFVALRSSGAIATGLTWDATVEGGALSGARARTPTTPGGADTLSYARGELGALAATTFGPIAASLAARGAGDVASEGARSGSDRAAAARLRFGIPLARSWSARGENNDPLLHAIEPFVETALLHAGGDALLGTLPGRGTPSVAGTAPIADAGVVSTLGRWGAREAIELGVAGGAAFGSDVATGAAQPIFRARAAATFEALALQAESGHLVGDRTGSAAIANVRLGKADGLRLLANVASRSGIDPTLARALADAPLEPPAGFLARRGTTGGSTLVVPWSHAFTTTAGADADATARELVAVRGGVELRDRCGCVTLRLNGAHRIGRDGVDVWLALSFASDR